MTEEARGIMGATITGKRTWFSGLSNVQCQLVFTTERIILARTMGQMSDPLGSATYWVTTDAERLRGLDLETILSADEENFSVTYAEITKIEVGSKWRNSRANVYTRTRVYKFMWTWPAKLEDVEAPLRELLPKNITLQRVNKLD